MHLPSYLLRLTLEEILASKLFSMIVAAVALPLVSYHSELRESLKPKAAALIFTDTNRAKSHMPTYCKREEDITHDTLIYG